MIDGFLAFALGLTVLVSLVCAVCLLAERIATKEKRPALKEPRRR